MERERLKRGLKSKRHQLYNLESLTQRNNIYSQVLHITIYREDCNILVLAIQRLYIFCYHRTPLQLLIYFYYLILLPFPHA